MWILALLFVPATFAVLLVLEACEKPLGKAPEAEEADIPVLAQVPHQRTPRVPINN